MGRTQSADPRERRQASPEDPLEMMEAAILKPEGRSRASTSVGTRRFSLRRVGVEAPDVVPGVVRARDALYRRSLAVADVVAAVLTLVLTVVVLGDDALKPAAAAALPAIVLLSKVSGLYDRDELLLRKSTLEEIPRLFQVATLGAFLVWLAAPAFVDGTLGRDQVVGMWAMLFLSLFGGRALVRRLVSGLVPEERCLVLGESASVTQLDDKFQLNDSVKATVVGRLPLQDGYRRSDDIERMSDLIAEQEIHRVIIAPSGEASMAILDAIRLVKSLGAKVSVLPRLFEVVGSSVEFDDIDGVTVLGLPRYGLTKSSGFLKRAVDLVAAAGGLVLLGPLMLIIAVAVKASSTGPVLFRQPRIGRNGREFEMLKFRSMFEGADSQKAGLLDLNESDGLFKIERDPRVTSVGRLLRGLSLDELPQLINVLRGDMSLVGPRPLVPDEDRRVEGWHRRRLDLPPGMTGVWQSLGSARIPLQEMVKIDYLYGANWSLWLDTKIVLRTLVHVLARRGM